MATGKKTGKKAADIFKATTKPDIGLEVAPRPLKGRPPATEAYSKVTVCIYDRHVLLLDKAALAIRERTGQPVKRAELIRAIIEHAAEDLKPDAPGFDKTVKTLLAELGT